MEDTDILELARERWENAYELEFRANPPIERLENNEAWVQAWVRVGWNDEEKEHDEEKPAT